MILLHQYHIAIKNGIFYAIADETCRCPSCGGPLSVRDSKKRHLILAGGEVQTFRLRRLKCRDCNALHLELPDIFLPYKHYSREVIMKALDGLVSDCPAENSTIYRWSREKHSSESSKERRHPPG